jgi:hypothetical protein
MGPAAEAFGRGEHFVPPAAPVTAVLQDILSRPIDMAAGRQRADAVTTRQNQVPGRLVRAAARDHCTVRGMVSSSQALSSPAGSLRPGES